MAMKFDFRAKIDKILQNLGDRQPPKGCIIWQKAKTSSPVGKQYARMRNPFPGCPVVTTAHRVLYMAFHNVIELPTHDRQGNKMEVSHLDITLLRFD